MGFLDGYGRRRAMNEASPTCVRTELIKAMLRAFTTTVSRGRSGRGIFNGRAKRVFNSLGKWRFGA